MTSADRKFESIAASLAATTKALIAIEGSIDVLHERLAKLEHMRLHIARSMSAES